MSCDGEGRERKARSGESVSELHHEWVSEWGGKLGRYGESIRLRETQREREREANREDQQPSYLLPNVHNEENVVPHVMLRRNVSLKALQESHSQSISQMYSTITRSQSHSKWIHDIFSAYLRHLVSVKHRLFDAADEASLTSVTLSSQLCHWDRTEQEVPGQDMKAYVRTEGQISGQELHSAQQVGLPVTQATAEMVVW